MKGKLHVPKAVRCVFESSIGGMWLYLHGQLLVLGSEWNLLLKYNEICVIYINFKIDLSIWSEHSQCEWMEVWKLILLSTSSKINTIFSLLISDKAG